MRERGYHKVSSGTKECADRDLCGEMVQAVIFRCRKVWLPWLLSACVAAVSMTRCLIEYRDGWSDEWACKCQRGVDRVRGCTGVTHQL